MADEHDLEAECEDAVYQVAYTRAGYPNRCASKLEKQLELVTKIQTAPVAKSEIPTFSLPASTPEQDQLINQHRLLDDPELEEAASNVDVRGVSKRLKELKGILRELERYKSSKIHELLK